MSYFSVTVPKDVPIGRPRPSRCLLAWLNRNEVTFKAAGKILELDPNRLRALATGSKLDPASINLQFELLERLRAHYGR